eukprot:6163678-Pleurochrysis_carterae.AAC.1
MLEKKTPISLFRWALKKRMSVTKMSSESCRMAAIGETPFLSSDRQRYCRMAQMNFSPERKVAPELWMMELSSWSESSLERSSIESSDGSGSGSGFIDSLQSERKTRKASRWMTGG